MRVLGLLIAMSIQTATLSPNEALAQTIDGIDVRLGASRAATLALFRKGGYALDSLRIGPEVWWVRLDGTAKVYGKLEFRGGRLARVTRDWYLQGGQDLRQYMTTVVSALSTLKEEGGTCKIVPHGGRTPQGTLDAIIIDCGVHAVEISIFTATLQGVGTRTSVEEVWKTP
jgi:hypothetical protein